MNGAWQRKNGDKNGSIKIKKGFKKMDLKKDNLNINPAIFRLRGTYNGAKIETEEIVLLTYIIFLQNNNCAKNKKDYCAASNAALSDYLYLPQGDASNRKIQRMLTALEKAGFISRQGKASRKIYVHFNFLGELIEGRLSAEPTLEEKKEASSQRTKERLEKQGNYTIPRLEAEEAPKQKESVESIIKKAWDKNALEDSNINRCQLWLEGLYSLSDSKIREIASSLGLRSAKLKSAPKTNYYDEDYYTEDFDEIPF